MDGVSSGKASMVGPQEKPIKLVAEFRDACDWFELGPGEGRRIDKPGEAEEDWKRVENGNP